MKIMGNYAVTKTHPLFKSLFNGHYYKALNLHELGSVRFGAGLFSGFTYLHYKGMKMTIYLHKIKCMI